MYQPEENLSVEVEVPKRLARGRVPLVAVRVMLAKSVPASRTVSGRLNLWEGDLRFILKGPNGETHSVRAEGAPPDTGPFTLRLDPGQQLAVCVNLSVTSIGYPFDTPGNYTLAATYFPAPRQTPVQSPPIVMSVFPAVSDEDSGVANILLSPAGEPTNRARALFTAQADWDRKGLADLARLYGQTPEGVMSELLLASQPDQTPWPTAQISSNEGKTPRFAPRSVDAVLTDALTRGVAPDLTTLALWITCLETPFNNSRGDLGAAFVAWVTANFPSGIDAQNASNIARFHPV